MAATMKFKMHAQRFAGWLTARRAATASAPAAAAGPVCEFCNDDKNWKGVPAEERQAFCGPAGLGCPGFGGPEAQ